MGAQQNRYQGTISLEGFLVFDIDNQTLATKHILQHDGNGFVNVKFPDWRVDGTNIYLYINGNKVLKIDADGILYAKAFRQVRTL